MAALPDVAEPELNQAEDTITQDLDNLSLGAEGIICNTITKIFPESS